MYFLYLQIEESDQLPKQICHACIYKVELFSEFKELTKKTDREFRNFLSLSSKRKLYSKGGRRVSINIFSCLITVKNKTLLCVIF